MLTKSLLVYLASFLVTISALSVGILCVPLGGDNGETSVSRSISDPERLERRGTCDIKKYKKGDSVELKSWIPGETYTTKAKVVMKDTFLYGILDLGDPMMESSSGPSKHFKVTFTPNFGQKKAIKAMAQVFPQAEPVEYRTADAYDLSSCYWVIIQTAEG